jgi:sigma-54 specific flagellar transcriptional regulator A
MVQSTTRYSCVVNSSLSILHKHGDVKSTAVVLLDRSLPVADLKRLSGLLDDYPVATFGAGANHSDLHKIVGSSVRYQLRHPVEAPDLERLFSRLANNAPQNRPAGARRPLHLHRGLVGDSEAVTKLKAIIDQVAPSKANILILGETGTGKEVVARNIHYRSAGKLQAFVPVNCSAIPTELLESELFGHKKGSFTGAVSNRVGRFELASGGTLFLDEIGDMPLALQVKLLRVLEEREIYPLGADNPVPMTARLIAATHQNLEDMVERGTFREDLYYRLNVVPITVPPLRERTDDIPNLTHDLRCRLETELNTGVEFSQSATECMQHYSWPGNVRELANFIERLTVLHPGGRVEVEDLPAEIRGATNLGESSINVQPSRDEVLADSFDLKEYLRSTEETLIRQALEATGGVVSNAAKLLQIKRTTLCEKVKRLGLDQLIEYAGSN